MGKKKVSYSSNWDADFKWLRSTNDPSAAFYTVCSKKFCIDNVRKSQVEFPEHGMFHIKHVNAQKGQRTFVKSAKEDSLVISEVSSSLSIKEHVLRAKTIQALNCVNSDLSFASANDDGDRSQSMFLDSKIVEKYSQNEIKMKYVIQYDLSPCFQDLLKSDLKGKPFSFKFDETTTS